MRKTRCRTRKNATSHPRISPSWPGPPVSCGRPPGGPSAAIWAPAAHCSAPGGRRRPSRTWCGWLPARPACGRGQESWADLCRVRLRVSAGVLEGRTPGPCRSLSLGRLRAYFRRKVVLPGTLWPWEMCRKCSADSALTELSGWERKLCWWLGHLDLVQVGHRGNAEQIIECHEWVRAIALDVSPRF